MAEWRYELQTNIGEVLNQIKTLQNRVDELENEKHQINLDIDSKKLEKVINNLDKMLESLGKGTGDFKEFENLSKQLADILKEAQTLNKALGGVNDKGISNLLSSISNIDRTLSSLSEHIINVNKDFGKIGDEAGNNVGQINKVADATNGLADATNKLNNAQKNAGNKSNSPVINPKNNIDEILKIDEIISKVSEHAKSLTGKDNLIFDNRLNKLKDIFKNQDILKEFNKYALQTVNYDSLREMVNILNECKDNMLSVEDISQRFSSIVSSQFTATIPEFTKFDDTIFRMLETIKEFGASTNTYQSSGKDLFSWIKENGTDAQKTLFRVTDSYEEFQRVLRGLSIGKEGIFNYSTSLNLDTLTFDISSIDNILSKENELENESNIAQKELSELRSILINTFNISPESDGTLTVTLKQLQEIIEQYPKAKQYIDEINSLISNKSNISSENITNQIVANEKKKQEAYKATADAVMYHAGVISKLNKAETNGRFYGSDRGTGYFGTGHYFVDNATKHELDNNGSYSKLPYTSIDISQYDNLFKATTNEIADGLHTFLKNLTKFTQGSDTYSISELFSQFQKVFGETTMDMQEFDAKLEQLKTYMQNSNMYDRGDSVSTQFMKSLGYGGVDTRGTKYADTRYGTVIYDLKEESILQANITDELQKQGQMLEKINYEKGQVFDKSEDARIQGIIDEQNKDKEIQSEFEKLYDATQLRAYESELDSIDDKLSENKKIIDNCRSSIETADEDARRFAKDFADMFDEEMISDDEIKENANRSRLEYQERISELEEENQLLLARKSELEANIEGEAKLVNAARERAKAIVEERNKPIEDVFQGDNKATTDASTTAIKEESQALEQVSTSAKEAATSKEKFANANKEVRASADSSSTSLDEEKKKIENVGDSVEETKKKLDDVVFKPNTEGFDEIVSKLDIAKDKIEEISKITKSSVWSESQGEYLESYNIKYKNGTSEIRGESSSKKGSNVLRANEVAYNAKVAEQQRKANESARKESLKKSESEQKAKQSETDKALKDQLNAYKKIQEIKYKLSYTEDDGERSKLLERQKLYQEEFSNAGKILSANSELYSIEQQTNELTKVRLEYEEKIAKYKADQRENQLSSIQKSIKSYNNDYSSRINGKPVEKNRSQEYQQLLDKYKASIDALQAKKDELSKQPTISESDLDSVRKMTEAVEENKNALIAMSNAKKGSSEGSRRKEIDKITKYLKDNTRISEEAKTKLKEYLDLLRNGGADVNVDEIHNGFLKVTDAERLAGNEGKRFLDVIRDKAWYGWAAQIASYFSLQDIIRYFKEGATVVKEFDDGLTNISYTMDVTKSQLDGIGQSVLDLSKDLKSSIDDSMQVAKIYANMNTTAEEIKKLSEPTLIMTNLTGFDAATMADDIQAVTQQFEIAAEDSMHIADVYDTVSRSISVDYSKFLELTLETM